MSTCNRCGGTGEIPLLGANTTTCPDCEDYPTWETVPDDEWLRVSLKRKGGDGSESFGVFRQVQVDAGEGRIRFDVQWVDLKEYETTPEEAVEHFDGHPLYDRTR